jgi:hypothetical protein
MAWSMTMIKIVVLEGPTVSREIVVAIHHNQLLAAAGEKAIHSWVILWSTMN